MIPTVAEVAEVPAPVADTSSRDRFHRFTNDHVPLVLDGREIGRIVVAEVLP